MADTEAPTYTCTSGISGTAPQTTTSTTAVGTVYTQTTLTDITAATLMATQSVSLDGQEPRPTA